MAYQRRNTHKRIMDGSIESISERIATTYIETGRTMRSLAKLYNCSPATIRNYLNRYARDNVPYSLYRQIRNRAKQNMQEVYHLGRSVNCNSDELGRYD